ncbi:MAG: hypothetical protein J7L55_00735 [Desulfurococcales archaeon]|nr:hypothetical protein [Desulfurococcales archaeon]
MISEAETVKSLTRFRRRKGVSDLVVVLTLIAISIPIAMALQNWLGAQASRMNSYVTVPTLQGVVVGKSSGHDYSVIILKIRNTGDVTYDLSKANVSIILKNGTVLTNSTSDLHLSVAGSADLPPNHSSILSVKVEGVSLDEVKTVVINVGSSGGSTSLSINTE